MTADKKTQDSLVAKLKKAGTTARNSQEKAERDMATRNSLVLQAADSGVTYGRIAEALSITVDGVTYVLRRMRRGR